MKNSKRLTGIVGAATIAALTLVGSVAPAFAENTLTTNEPATSGETTTTQQTNSDSTSFSFKKKVYLQGSTTSAPKGDVTFTVTGVDPSVSAINNYKTAKGTAALTATTASFGYDDKVHTDSKGSYVEKDVTIDLSSVLAAATEPTVYTYKITENTPSYMSASEGTDRYLNVYVGYGADHKTLKIMGTTLAKEATNSTTLNEEGSKTTDFKNQYVSHDLNITKEVTGNQGYYDQNFHFRVVITNQHAKVTLSSEQNTGTDDNKTLNPDSDGNLNFTVTLRHNQTVKINGLTEGATYQVTENEADQDNYTTTATGNEGTISNENASAQFTNNREGTVPTGLYHNNRLAINIVGVAVAGGVIAIAVKRKHDRADDGE